MFLFGFYLFLLPEWSIYACLLAFKGSINGFTNPLNYSISGSGGILGSQAIVWGVSLLFGLYVYRLYKFNTRSAPKWMYWSYGLGYFSNFVFNRLNFWETARWSH